MAKIEKNKAEIKEGIRSNPSGTMAILHFPRAGVITGLKEPIHVKRPNQTKKKKATKKKAKK